MEEPAECYFPPQAAMDERVQHLLARLKLRHPQAGGPDDMLEAMVRFQPIADLVKRAREARGWSQARAARALRIDREELADLEGVVGLFGDEFPWLPDLAWLLGIGEPLAQWVEANPRVAFTYGVADAPTVRAAYAEYRVEAQRLGRPLPVTFVPPQEWRDLASGPLEAVPSFLSAGLPSGYRLLATIRGIEPTIWRRLEVREDLTLGQLHEVMQVIFGWNTTHSHAWDAGERRFGRPDQMDEADVIDDRKVTLNDLMLDVGEALTYWYDFGDGWRVRVELEAILPAQERPAARCLNGRRAGPPDDCGGPPGFADILATLAGPPSERRREVTRWLGPDFDPEAFDPDDSNAALARRNRRWQPPKR